MEKRDYYEILGVDKTASATDIKKSYRRIAMRNHPDRNPDDSTAEERFKEATEAYEVLSDEQKRAAYDQFGHAGVDPQSSAPNFDFGSFFDNIFDGFGSIFGGGGSTRQRARGSDLGYRLSLTLEQAAQGDKTTLKVPTLVACESCHGSGSESDRPPSPCATCNGHGQVIQQQGFLQIRQTCPACGGRGHVISDPCKKCDGAGRVQDTQTLEVDIPAGVDSGNRIRLSGKGEAGAYGEPAGDLYVEIEVSPHDTFERHHKNLYCRQKVDMVTAALGGEIDVQTLEGKTLRVKVPAETQSGKQLRLPGKGVVSLKDSSRGDLICELFVRTPTGLNKKQKKILEEFRKSTE